MLPLVVSESRLGCTHVSSRVFVARPRLNRIDQDDCRQYLSVFDREPFSFASTRRQSLRKQKKQDSEEYAPPLNCVVALLCPLIPTYHLRRLANSQDESSDGNDETMLTYPLPPCSSDIVTIIRRDILRLKPERYLNDNVIDYYFKCVCCHPYLDNGALL